jgi:exosortase A-associated hydrolase 2
MGRLFCIHHFPELTKQLVIVAPFAEEMNKSRRMFTLLARALAERGCGTLVLDLYGTGDSEGNFTHARWPTWKHDVECALTYVQDRGAEDISLLGLRLGALLGMETVCKVSSGISRVVLWQPVVNGNAYLTQFLRLSLAADLAAEKKASTQELRQRLLAGDALEIAGYTLASELAFAIDAASLRTLSPPQRLPIHWIEVASQLSAASIPLIERWQARATNVAGAPFWATSEITLAPELIDKTVGIFG